jgi:hypothetical protein
MMHQTNCLNCGEVLSPQQNFCGNCSQSANIHRLTTPHIAHEVLHSMTHADKGLLYLIKELAISPGVVAREYIEGKRKKYFNPFSMLLILLGFFVFMGSIFHPFSTEIKPDPQVLKNIPSEVGRQKYIGRMKRVSRFTHFIEKYVNVTVMLSTPLMTLVYLLCFYKRKYNYAELLTANVFFAGFYSLVTTFLIIPVMGLTKGGKWYGMVVLINFFLHALYFGWGYYQLMEYKRKLYFLKTFLVALLAILSWVVFSVTLNILYAKYGG